MAIWKLLQFFTDKFGSKKYWGLVYMQLRLENCSQIKLIDTWSTGIVQMFI